MTASEDIDLMMPRVHHFDAPNPHGEIGTHRIAFYEWGDVYNPPIFCVHGLTRNGRDFDHLAKALAKNYRVIAVDIAGRGKSAPLKKPEWYQNTTYMHDMLALAEFMNLPKFDWIGTSMGGMIGMMIAALEPGKIQRMVLNDIGAELSAEGVARIGEYVGRVCEFRDMDHAQQSLRTLMTSFGISDEEHWAHLFEHSLVQQTSGSITLAYDPMIGEGFRMLIEQAGGPQDISLWMFWEAIDIPTLIVRGSESDILSRECALRMCEAHHDTTLVEFDGIGHAPTLMEDLQIEAIVKWLGGTK